MPPRVASRFASRGAFDALAAQKGDNSSDDHSSDESDDGEDAAVVAQPAVHPEQSQKLTKTQQKKLAKEAREAKKREKQAKSNAATAAPSTNGTGSTAATINGADSKEKEQMQSVKGNADSSEDPPGLANDKIDPKQAATEPSPSPLVKDGKSNDKEELEPAVASSGKAVESAQQPPTVSAPTQSVPEVSKSSTLAPPSSSSSSSSRQKTVANRSAADALSAATDDADKIATEKAAYWKKIQERTLFTFAMIFGFIGILCLGHPYIILLILVIQVLVYREVTALFEIPGRPSITGGAPRRGPLSRHNSMSKVPKIRKTNVDDFDESAQVSEDEEDFREEERKELVWSKTLSWYFFTVANFFLYGESLIYYFKHIVFVDSYFGPFARHHRFLSFLLYVIGFVGFVSGLRRENLKHQFGLFGWVHMSLLLIVFSSHFLVNNVLEGIIWLFLPASLVVCNDCFAYVCGMIWGRTPLISLSPKKTVEGFVGAFVITEVFALGWSTLFQRYNYMICPAVSLGMNALQEIHCKANPVFEWHTLELPLQIASVLPITSISYTPFQLHSLVMASFASLVAPFGGFFASGFKRAFNIKDFGDSIPGHGGLTDRFDCQFLMGLFAYVYFSSLIRESGVSVGSVLQTVVSHLGQEEQIEVYREIGRYLVSRGVKV